MKKKKFQQKNEIELYDTSKGARCALLQATARRAPVRLPERTPLGRGATLRSHELLI